MSSSTKPTAGFTLVELLIVVAIIGIIAAIAIPNLLSAIQRGKQKRTMGDIKTLGYALEAYQTDASTYPVGGALAAIGDGAAGVAPLWDPAGVSTTVLNPDYQKIPIWKDGWWSSQNTPANLLQYGTNNAGGQAVDYILCSLAKDNAATPGGGIPNGCVTIGPPPYTGASGTTFECDITMVDGQMLQQPEGKQRNLSGC